ncbi:MAG TPA: caspase family protein [Geminicoccaceae bacterium]
MTRLMVLALSCLTAAAPVRAARGEIHAIVAGADAYRHVPELAGAVSDALDLADQLTWLGATTSRLIDGGLNRPALMAAFEATLAAAGPDDVIVFSYAGHGLQIPDQNGDEADGYDETFVLPEYEPGIGDRTNLILDDEIDDFVRRAAPRPVIFVADSCHSGTMLRSVDPRADHRRIRSLPRSSFGPTPEARARPIAADRALPPDNLLFVGAVPENLVVQEVLIEGRPRGALSYAVARSLGGSSDLDGDRVVTSDEMSAQVVQMVRALSEARQTPQVFTGIVRGRPLFHLPEAAPVAPVKAMAKALDLEPVRVATPDDGGPMPVLGALEGAVLVATAADAELIFDPATGDVLTSQGDQAARLGPARGQDLLQGIVDKWRLLGALESRIDGSVEARVWPDDRLFADGASFEVEISTERAGRLVLFDLASDGSLIQLLPRAGQAAPEVAAGSTLRETFRAGPPFGADHLVAAVLTAADADPVVDLLRSVHGRPLGTGEAERLVRMIARGDALFVPVYTAP